MWKSFYCVLISTLATSFAAQAITHHEIQASIDPLTHKISVTDRVTFSSCQKHFTVTLHSGLKLVVLDPMEAFLVPLGQETIDSTHELDVEHYSLALPCDGNSVTLQYQGEIFHPILDATNPYSRGTSDTPGIISEEGVVLSASTYWYPQFDEIKDEFVTFTLDAKLPKDWKLVGQGERLTADRWQELHPQDDIYLIAAKFTEYEQLSSSGVKLQVFLRTADETLAKTYLEATAEYVDRYSRLIGPYPYAKFALVENFWDTGFGMPSFTLLGSNIIRLPFIINTSYPHEILHDWWGNSVFVDYTRGNWCEGITAYMADHLMAERTQDGDSYRRDTLQKYTDFVNEKNDFPLNRFLGRTDAPTEAVGYGKALMFFHMLRLEVGDDFFRRSFAGFFLDNQYRRASYDEIRAAFETTTGRSFAPQFKQWVERTGAPTLKLSAVSLQTSSENVYTITARIEQIQSEDIFEIDLPIAIHLQDQEQALQKTYRMNSRTLEISERFASRPVWFEVDPEFDIFRRLSRDEVPPVMTMALGAPKTLMILPASVGSEAIKNWRGFADILTAALPKNPDDISNVEVVLDSDLKDLPVDRAIWILGHENRFVSTVADLLSDQPMKFSADGLELDGAKYLFADHSFTIVARNKAQADQVLVFADTDKSATFPILANKLTHYGKYSFLAFESEKVKITSKGIWKLQSSAMSVPVLQADGTAAVAKKGRLAPRPPLAQ